MSDPADWKGCKEPWYWDEEMAETYKQRVHWWAGKKPLRPIKV